MSDGLFGEFHCLIWGEGKRRRCNIQYQLIFGKYFFFGGRHTKESKLSPDLDSWRNVFVFLVEQGEKDRRKEEKKWWTVKSGLF